MAIIPQQALFAWDQVEVLGDLERLVLVLDALPDEALVRRLEAARGRGRNEYPVRGLWNCLLAGIVFQHPSIESLRRELLRNGQLRTLCGLRRVPPASVYSRFYKKLMAEEALLSDLFEHLVTLVQAQLPEFGQALALDAKGLSSWAKRRAVRTEPDGRRDVDADYGRKSYSGARVDGSTWEKKVTWFGYKLHLLVDSTYELPVSFLVTRASVADIKGGRALLQQVERRQPQLLEQAQVLTADKGYDDGKLITWLWDQHGVKPVIDIRMLWRDDQTRELPGHADVVYDQHGEVSCYCPQSGVKRAMVHGGFERDRGTLKKLCPAKHYGLQCKGQALCKVSSGLRVPLEIDRRIFTPLDRSSYAWPRAYRRRTAVERVNSRLDVSFGFELHTIRGLKKMQVRCSLALSVMLAMALGHIQAGHPTRLRRLVS